MLLSVKVHGKHELSTSESSFSCILSWATDKVFWMQSMIIMDALSGHHLRPSSTVTTYDANIVKIQDLRLEL